MPNLIEGLQEELARNRGILTEYEAIPMGAFGALMIRQAITAAEAAIASGDTIEMIRCYKELQGIK